MADQFEQEFGDLAYSYLQAQGSPINKFLVGFEIVRVNEDQTKAEGLFVINIRGKHYLVPVIFNNGAIKPLILLIDYDKDRVLPLSDDWLDFIASRSPQQMGEGIKDIDFADRFNMRDILEPPDTVKYAEESLSLLGFLEKAANVTKNVFTEWLKTSSELRKFAFSMYGDDLIKALKPHVSVVKKASQRLTLYNKQTNIDVLQRLPISERLSIEKRGYAIQDARVGEEINEAVTIEGIKCLYTPHEDGIYKLFTNQGQRDCFVCVSPFALGGRMVPHTLVVDPDKNDYGIFDSSEVLVSGEAAQFDKFEKKLKLKSLKEIVESKGPISYGKYCLFNTSAESGKSGVSEPFWLEGKTKTSDGDYILSVSPDISSIRNTGRRCHNINILFKKHGSMVRQGKDLILPESVKILKLGNNTLDVFGREPIGQQFKSAFDKMQMVDNKLYYNDDFVHDFRTQEKSAFFLANKVNLSVEDAYKFASIPQPFHMRKCAMGPFVPELAQGTAPETEFYDAEEFTAPSPGYDAVSDDIGRAMELSDHGNKEIFEHSVAGALSNNTDPGELLKSYVPDYIQGLDKLGRTLYLVWTKAHLFKDSFGINELTRFEEQLVDTFKSMGKIVLDLKKKGFGIE